MSNKRRNANFFLVSNCIFEIGLRPRELAVYCCLLYHCDRETMSCYPSRRLIADECQMDRKTVDAAMKTLTALGLVRIVSRKRENGSRTSNLYIVSDLIAGEGKKRSGDSVRFPYQEQDP